MYFVFDMDETLAELYSAYSIIKTIVDSQYYDTYKAFVRYVANEEISTHPLGIIRPGILEIMIKHLINH